MAFQTKLPLAPSPSVRVDDVLRTKASSTDQPAPIWLQRLSLAVLVVFCLYLGVLLVYLPWWKEMWDHNSLLLEFPTLRGYLIRGPVRGCVSGLGMLDLWIGISEIIHYREYRS